MTCWLFRLLMVVGLRTHLGKAHREEKTFTNSGEKAMRLSREEMARACVESLLDSYTLMYSSSPRKVLWQEPDMTLFSTGAPSIFQNGVLRARFTSKNMATRTKHALEYFKRRQLPMTWLVDPWSTPAGLGRFLQNQGLILEWDIPCMAMYLG